MGQKDWDPDDLLDFDYGHPVGRDKAQKSQGGSQRSSQDYRGGQSNSDRHYEELRQYEALRHSDKQAEAQPVYSSASYSGAPEEIGKSRKAAKAAAKRKKRQAAAAGQAASKTAQVRRTPEENAALKQAQQEAYDRYRSTYSKNTMKKAKRKKASIFTRGLSIIYLIALAVFLAVMTIMDIIPFGVLAALYGILGLLSLIIVIQLRKPNVRRWVRSLATLTALALIAVYGVGSAYAMGTLSFLDFTSVANDKKVASVTKQPFNVCITGMDVKGKIDTEGRSDVNMIVTVNPKTYQILMTSIPRDYQIYMPDKDYAMDKLTHTGFYGVSTTIGAEEDLLDTSINYFVKVNFSTVQKFIDAIGGVDVYSEYEFTPVKLKSWTVQEGMNHMNGKQALAFARERKAFVSGDNQRIKNQQAVFEAMIKKATSSKTMVLSYNKIISSLKDYFQMSVSSAEFRSLIKLQLGKNPDWKIYKNSLVGDNGSERTYSTGNAYAYVMLQDQESIDNAKALINAVMNGDTLDKDEDGNVYVVNPEGESESVDE